MADASSASLEQSLERQSSDVTTPDSDPSSPSSRPSSQDATSPKPPSLRALTDTSAPTMSSSSSPLGGVNAARRPAPPPTRASGLSSDIQAKMKAFSLSRQGPPPSSLRPTLPGQHAASTGAIPSPGFAGGALTGASPNNSTSNLRIPGGMNRANPPSFNSAPSAIGGSPRMLSPKPGVGGFGARRGVKPGGMKLSDATKPPDASEQGQVQSQTGSQFTKYSNIIDTQKGTLNFKNKAVIHGHGIEFSSGSSFSISLDEVDTLDELGKGNYGTVFKVRHARPKMRKPGQGLRGALPKPGEDTALSAPTHGTTGVVMAMKEIRLELEDSKFAAIIMELDILHKCISPFIVSFYGAFFQEGSVYICMEHMDGGSVDKLYGDGVPEGVLKKITLSTVMGLKSLKDEHNIIHRDVKPTNILVNTRGQVKICDFGVSGNLVASIAKTNIGCQSYMAPERISGGGMSQAGANPGGGSYSVQSDIWSLGLTIIECALGRYPYPPETYDNIFSQLSAIVDGEPPNLPAATFSESARDFVHGCLNKTPKLRPAYAMLLRHAWLAPLLKPPTIAEDEEAEAAAEAGMDHPTTGTIGDGILHPESADKEIANWVINALERKRAGKMATVEKPALHAVALDAVPGGHGANSLMDHGEDEPAAQVRVRPEEGVDAVTVVDVQANPGVKIDAPELNLARIETKDFAGGFGADGAGEIETGVGDETASGE